jgi:hypothetical protein
MLKIDALSYIEFDTTKNRIFGVSIDDNTDCCVEVLNTVNVQYDVSL